MIEYDSKLHTWSEYIGLIMAIGYSCRQISLVLGVDRHTVRDWIRGVKSISADIHAEKLKEMQETIEPSWCTKTAHEDRAEKGATMELIFQLRQAGWNYRTISEACSLHRDTIKSYGLGLSCPNEATYLRMKKLVDIAPPKRECHVTIKDDIAPQKIGKYFTPEGEKYAHSLIIQWIIDHPKIYIESKKWASLYAWMEKVDLQTMKTMSGELVRRFIQAQKDAGVEVLHVDTDVEWIKDEADLATVTHAIHKFRRCAEALQLVCERGKIARQCQKVQRDEPMSVIFALNLMHLLGFDSSVVSSVMEMTTYERQQSIMERNRERIEAKKAKKREELRAKRAPKLIMKPEPVSVTEAPPTCVVPEPMRRTGYYFFSGCPDPAEFPWYYRRLHRS